MVNYLNLAASLLIAAGFIWFVIATRKIAWKPMVIAEVAIAAGLSLVFGFLKIGQLPQGGSITLAILPVLVIAFRRGLVPGVVTGVLAGFLQMICDPFFVHPLQIALDYPFAWGALGLAGVVVKDTSRKKFVWIIGIATLIVVVGFISTFFIQSGTIVWDRYVMLAILVIFLGASLFISGNGFKGKIGAVALGSLGRFIFHFVSGVFFFAQYALPGYSVVGYVALYIFSHLFFEAILSAIVIIPLQRSSNLMEYQESDKVSV